MKQGFTLLELSIVIVIIGLIAAGISAGQSLVKQSNIRAFAANLSKYDLAINSFRLQYDAIPGDFSLAQSYWGVGTSNGNGNGTLEHITNDQLYNFERPLFFQHLSLSKLIDETYDGSSTAGVGYPLDKNLLPSMGYVAGYQNRNICSAKSGLALYFSVVTHASMPNINFADNVAAGQGYDSKDVYNIDRKIDDGAPGTGNFGGTNGNPAPCIVNASTYDLDATSNGCRICYMLIPD